MSENTKEEQKDEQGVDQFKGGEMFVELVKRLVEPDTPLGELGGTMLAARQLYVMCLNELYQLIRTLDLKEAAKKEGLPDLDLPEEFTEEQLNFLSEVLVHSVAHGATKPFDENNLFRGLTDTVFPWVRETVEKHNAMQSERREKLFKEREEERVTSKLSLGFKLFDMPKEDACYFVDRDRPVVFVGEAAALRWLTHLIVYRVVDEADLTAQVVHLHRQVGTVERHDNVVAVGSSLWDDVASDGTKISELYGKSIFSILDSPVDVLLVEDLTHAHRGWSGHGNEVYRSYMALKHLRRWSAKAGCLLVGCLPQDSTTTQEDLDDEKYEALRIHNTVRFVQLKKVEYEGEQRVYLQIGGEDVTYMLESEFADIHNHIATEG